MSSKPRLRCSANNVAEFTNHQRNVFCVFSGQQVVNFREHLLKADQFQDLRDSLEPRRNSRARQVSAQVQPATASALPTAFEETYDDEMGDDNDDFEGIYPTNMMPNAQPNNGFAGNGFQGHGNLPSMAHSLPTLPGINTLPWDLPNSLAVDGTGFHPGGFAAQHNTQGPPSQQGSFAAQNSTQGHQFQQSPLPTLASLIGNQGAYASSSMSAFGVPQASVAGPVTTGPGQASSASAATATAASTAQMHQQADAEEQSSMNG